MLQKIGFLFGILIAVLLLFVATVYYPGGSYLDANSNSFNWQHNYFSNLFTPKSGEWFGQFGSTMGDSRHGIFDDKFVRFFIRFSNKMVEKSAVNGIKYSGLVAMIATFLVVTPLHDLMIRIACVFSMIAYFYITVFVFKTKLFF